MNFLLVSFTAASHKTFRHMLRSGVSSNVNIMIRGFATAAGNLESEQVVEKMNRSGDFVTYYKTLINDSSKAEELSRADQIRERKRLSPNKTTYTCLIDVFCKHGRFDVACRVVNEMFVSGFSPSIDSLNYVFCGCMRMGDMRNAYEFFQEMFGHVHLGWIYNDTYSLFLQSLSDEVTYTSLMNTFIDEGKFDDANELLELMEGLDESLRDYGLTHICALPDSVLQSVFINGLDNKARTTEINEYLLNYNYLFSFYLDRPIFEFHLTLAKNCNDDEFKRLVELVYFFCESGLENAHDTMLKLNYIPKGIDDGIIYNIFVIAHCLCGNIDEAYNMYKEMVLYGFACHVFTVFALMRTLEGRKMVNELLWVIQNILRSCNLNDSEIVKFLNEFNPEKRYIPLINVLAEKVKDGLFLKCSYAPEGLLP